MSLREMWLLNFELFSKILSIISQQGNRAESITGSIEPIKDLTGFIRDSGPRMLIPVDTRQSLLPVLLSVLPLQRALSRLIPFLRLLFSVDHLPGGESQGCPGQPSALPPPRLNPSASSPNFFKYLKHNSSGEQSGNAVPKR